MTALSPSRDTHASLAGKRVLLIGLNYGPEETGNAPYTTALAEHLVAIGARVTVLTGMPYYPFWSIFQEYRGRWRQREQIRGVDVRRVRQYVPRRQSAVRRALFEGTFLTQALLVTGLPRPDIVVGVVPSLSGGMLAAAAAARYRVPYGLLFQDLVGQSAAQSGIVGGGQVRGPVRAIEGWFSRRAAAVAVVAEGFRRYLEGTGVAAERICRVRNWTHVDLPTRTPEETRMRIGLPAEAFVCLHAGNMGLKQGLENVLAAARLARTSDPDLLFVLMGDGNQRAELEAVAEGLPNVRFLPPQPKDEFPNILAAADVLLVNQRPSVTDMSLPGKLTSYFAAGRPVVAAVAPGSETAAELATAQAGITVAAGDPAQLVTAIRSLAVDPSRADALGQQGQTYARKQLSAEASLARLEQFVCSIADASGPPPSIVGDQSRPKLPFVIRKRSGGRQRDASLPDAL